MTTVTTKAIAKVAAVATGLAMASSLLLAAPYAQAAGLTADQVNQIIGLLKAFGADASTLANVQASLTGGTPVMTGTGSGSMTSSCNFTTDLTVGSKGADVTCLQTALIAKGYLSASATGYFGSLTQAAVAKWQAAAGVTPAAGYFGAKSRAAWAAMGGSTPSNPTGPSAGTGTGLKVSLASDSPMGGVLVTGQAVGVIGKYLFSNPTSAPISVTNLAFKRIGVSNDSSLDNVYLYDSTGTMRLTDSASVNQSQFSFANPSALFTVPAMGTYEVEVVADIDSAANGQQIGVSLVNVTGAALDSSVTFPVNSGYQTVSSATPASVRFNTTTTGPSGNSSFPTGANQLVWQDTVNVSTNSVSLKSITFTNIGSAPTGSFANLHITVDGVAVGSTVAGLSTMSTTGNGSATFSLATPLNLTTGSHLIALYTDVVAGSSRTFNFQIWQSSDAQFIDNQLGVPVRVTDNAAGTSFSALGAATANTISGVSASSGVTVSKDPTSPTTNIPANVSGLKLATYSMQANGEAVKVTDLYVFANTSIHHGGLANGKVYLNGVQVGSTKTIVQGTSGTAASSATDFNLGSSLILPANTVSKVDIYADTMTSTSTALSNGETVQVYLAPGSNNGQGQSSFATTNVPNVETAGNSIIVASSALSASSYTGLGNSTVIAGSQNAKLGAFTLSSGSTEGVNVTQLTVTLSAANAASITNLKVTSDSAGTQQVGNTYGSPTTSQTFSTSGITIPSSGSQTFYIWGNVLSSANNGSFIASASANGTGSISGTAVTSNTATLQTISIGAGSLSVAQGSGDIVSQNAVAGLSNVKVGQFTFTGSNSSFTVNNLGILVPNAGASAISNLALQYTDATSGQVVTSNWLPVVSNGSTFATATFSGLNVGVTNGGTGSVTVLANLAPISASNTSGNSVNVSLDWGGTAGGNNSFRATDSAGNLLTTVGAANVASRGTVYVRKSIPTVSMVPLNQTVPTTGAPLYEFTVASDATGGAIDLSKFTFNIATTGTNTAVTNVYLVDHAAAGVNLLDNTTSSASTTQTTITIDLTKNATQPQHQEVSGSRTFDLYGTVAGFTTGSTITISLAQDTSAQANHVATGLTSNTAYNTVWSDESNPAMNGAAHTIGTADWTNGYLLQNFTNVATSYSK